MSRVNELVDTYYSPQIFAKRKRGYQSMLMGVGSGVCFFICGVLGMACLVTAFVFQSIWPAILMLVFIVLSVVFFITTAVCVIRAMYLMFNSQYTMEKQMVATHRQSVETMAHDPFGSDS